MNSHPTFEAELSYAIARGALDQTAADLSVLARYKDLEEARKQAGEVRRGVKAWTHILNQLRIRIRDEARAHIHARSPKNIMLAACHEINRTQSLREEEVAAIVVDAVWDSLPEAPRQRRGR